MNKLKIIRDVTTKECTWLSRDYKIGDTVYEYDGFTYGCIATGIAVTELPGKTPFFEIPSDALSVIK